MAGMKNVSKIVITASSLTPLSQRYLQISEVVATSSQTNQDIALASAGAQVSGSSSWPHSNAHYTIDGIGPSRYPKIFHPASGDTRSAFLSILLASPSELESITLFGRTDCCSNRDIYNIKLYDKKGKQLFSKENINANNASHSAKINLSNTINPHILPIALWHMDEYIGVKQNTVIDSSGNNFLGIAHNAASTEDLSPVLPQNPGTCGYGTFDGKDDYIEIPHHAKLNGNKSLTYSAWINPARWSGTQYIIAKSTIKRKHNAQMRIFYENGTLIAQAASNKGTITLTSPAPPIRQWHHIALVFAHKHLSLYVNGSLVQSTSFSPRTLTPSTAPVTISHDKNSFNGLIDEVQFFNQTLTQAQVKQIAKKTHICSSGSNKPVANWRLDAKRWGGASANTVIDYSGNNHSGIAINKLTTADESPAIANNPGTCRYADFNGLNYIQVADHPQLDISEELTVTSWVYPYALPRSDLKSIVSKDRNYELHLTPKGHIFWWWGGGTKQLTSTGRPLEVKQWAHVAIVYSNDRNMQAIYINGQLRASKSLSGKLQLNNRPLHIGGDQGIKSRLFNGRIDEVRVYNRALTQKNVQRVMKETHDCPKGGGVDKGNHFNCVENGADGIKGKLYTKTTAQAFSMDVVALRNANTIASTFAKVSDHKLVVELVNTKIPASCKDYPPLSPVVTQNLTMTASDRGTKASLKIRSNTAYSHVKCRVTDISKKPFFTGCSIDSFAIRPTNITATSSLNNAGSSGLPKAKAGETFYLTATALKGYTGTPLINTAKIQAHSGAVTTGILQGTFNAANVATGTSENAFTYSEVGALRFAKQGIYDEAFTRVDQKGDCRDDFSNTPIAGKVGCKFGNVSTTAYFGRFTPDHFITSHKSINNRAKQFCPTPSNFSYIGEAFQVGFTLTAKNASNATTQNYTGNFARLKNTVPTHFNFAAIDLADAIPPLAATALSKKLVLLSSTGRWIKGEATITALMNITRTVEMGAFESFTLGLAPVDEDGITLLDYNLDTHVPASKNDHERLATSKLRFGRLTIENAYGSELVDLSVPAYVEYYNGYSFIKNTDDSCTAIKMDHLTFNGKDSPITLNKGTSHANISHSPLKQSLSGLSLSAPGADNTGNIDIIGSRFIKIYPWLAYDWNGDGRYTNPPTARATFGLYKGNRQQIYFREVY